MSRNAYKITVLLCCIRFSCITVLYQQIENENIANQIHGFTIEEVANGKIRDSPRRRDPCLKIRDRDLKALTESDPETLYQENRA